MILVFSSQLSWKATALLLLAQLAFVLLQSSSGPLQLVRTWMYAQPPRLQPVSAPWSRQPADISVVPDPVSGFFHTAIPLVVVAATIGVFCYAARSEARRHDGGAPRRPWAGFPEMQRQREHPRSSSDLAAAINRLPIETYLDRHQLAALSARELKEKLEQRHVPVGRILEKEEAISELLAAGGSTADMCIVCFGEYRGGDTLRRLKCDHAFHVECIDRWLLSQRNGARCCPVCKDPLQL